MRCVCALFIVLGVASPLAAQVRRPPTPPPRPAPSVAVRPFFLASEQRFASIETFQTVFGRSVQLFLGGGAQVTFRDGAFIDVTISRFHQTGERAFRFNGESFQLGIPLSATIVPIEFMGGYRFGRRPRPGVLTNRPRFGNVVPYVGAGIGSYHYSETSEFSNPGDDVDARHAGYLAVAGAEFRVHPLMTVAIDVQYSRVGGILGNGGFSEDVGEDDLGGVAARFRIMIGR